MTTLTIKKKVIEEIQHTNNVEVLQGVYRLLEIDKTDLDILKLSHGQKQKILQGEKDIKNGKFLTNEQADKEIDKWLNK